jgi:hypothetical protein
MHRNGSRLPMRLPVATPVDQDLPEALGHALLAVVFAIEARFRAVWEGADCDPPDLLISSPTE